MAVNPVNGETVPNSYKIRVREKFPALKHGTVLCYFPSVNENGMIRPGNSPAVFVMKPFRWGSCPTLHFVAWPSRRPFQTSVEPKNLGRSLSTPPGEHRPSRRSTFPVQDNIFGAPIDLCRPFRAPSAGRVQLRIYWARSAACALRGPRIGPAYVLVILDFNCTSEGMRVLKQVIKMFIGGLTSNIHKFYL